MSWLILLLLVVVTALPTAIVVLPSAVRWIAARRHPAPAVDPFAALYLQARLGALADEIRRLEGDPGVYARAFRITATRTAYDSLLAEACVLAGVDPGIEGGTGPWADEHTSRWVEAGPAGRPGNESARMSAELELAARGWSW